MITDRDMKHQVTRSVEGHEISINLDEVVDELRATYGLVDIDTIDSAEYWAIVQKHSLAWPVPEKTPAAVPDITRIDVTFTIGQDVTARKTVCVVDPGYTESDLMAMIAIRRRVDSQSIHITHLGSLPGAHAKCVRCRESHPFDALESNAGLCGNCITEMNG